MAWTTPKTDWAAGEGIASTDLNRIEGKIQWNSAWQLQATLGGTDDWSVAAGTELVMTTVVRQVQASTKLILARVNYVLTAGDDWRVVVAAYDGLTLLNSWTSTNRSDDVSPETTLIDRTGLGTSNFFVDIHFLNSSTGDLTLRRYASAVAWFREDRI